MSHSTGTTSDQEQYLKALETLLESRIEAAENGAVSDQSIADIVDETLRETDKT